METPEHTDDLDRLVEVEARIDMYRSRRRGVMLRLVLIFFPLSVIALLVMDPKFSIPVTIVLIAAFFADHFIHYGRFRAAEQEREQILAERANE